MADKIQGLIVDDSDFIRGTLRSILDADPSIDVVGTATNGEEGLEKTLALKPNVVTMDLEMPVMSGFEAVERIMREGPTPIIVVSSMSRDSIIRTLDAGAMDFVSLSQGVEGIAEDLVKKVKIASRVRVLKRIKTRRELKPEIIEETGCGFKIIAVGVSTGGPQALKAFFSGIPADFPAGILVVQHMSPGFIEGMVEWLRSYSSADIRVPGQWDVLERGMAFVAPDSRHMEILADGEIRLSSDGSNNSLHVPSIDIMMKSVAAAYGKDAVGVLMTGMGKDGVEGMRAIRQAGGVTIAQDEESSVIFGMNRVAIEEGIVDRVVPLEEISTDIIRAARRGSSGV